MSLLYFASQDEGILVATFDAATKKISPPRPAGKVPGCFFLALHPAQPVLYSVDIDGGTVSALRLAPDGSFTELNRVESRGEMPCHIGVDPQGRFLIVANYMDGRTVLFPLRPDGGLHEAASVHRAVGTGPHPRQEKAHPHGVALAGDFVYVADLGVDRIWTLRVRGHELVPLDDLAAPVPPGAGPRHIVVHPDGKLALAVNELDNTVSSFRRDPASGRLTGAGTFPTLPPGFQGESYTAEIGFHPHADVCYATNRGHESLAVFSVDRATGELRPRQTIPTGKRPQHFVFDPAGKILLLASQEANSVSLHRLEAGLLTEQLGELTVSKPLCLVRVP